MDDIIIPPTAGDLYSMTYGPITVTSQDPAQTIPAYVFIEQKSDNRLDMIHITLEQLPKLIKALQAMEKAFPPPIIAGNHYRSKVVGDIWVFVEAVTALPDGTEVVIYRETYPSDADRTVHTVDRFRQLYQV